MSTLDDRSASQATADTRWHRCRLWTLRQRNRWVSAEVVWTDGEWHVRLFAQGILFLWQPCPPHQEPRIQTAV